MQQSTLLPAEPLASRGYRLHRLELYNWGTFDGQVFSVTPAGETTLLVGQNGSGKSTIVDALLTLLVRPGVRNFNVAAGAKKTERDERSYVKGAYDRSSDEEGGGVRLKFLRPKGDGYTAILACFRNLDTRRAFTVAQLLYLGGEQAVERVYLFADEERTIVHDLGGLGTSDGLAATLKRRGWKTARTFQEYESWFLKTIHAQKKAMEVFNQTVAVKDIQRLNDFIRHHMLEPHPWGDRVERLLAHFAQLSEAHQSLVRVRQQFELLEPIAAKGAAFRREADALAQAERLMAATDAFFAQKTIELFTPAIARRREAMARARARKETLLGEMQHVRELSRRIENEIEEAGGARLKQIPLEIRVAEAHVAEKGRERARYRDALRRAGVPQEAETAAAFDEVAQRLPERRAAIAGAVAAAEGERDALVLERGELRRTLADDRLELEGLQARRENLPEWAAGMRRALCEQLGLAAKDLPFAAELMAVHQEERTWEASIEKVLRGFALSLLVPQRLYRLVSSHVDRTRLTDGRGRGQRLVYLQVAESAPLAQAGTPGPDSLIRKLVFREGHPFLPWVKAELQARFDYRCCDTVEEFQQVRSLAITRARHAKTHERRHDKDDRDSATDARTFILGWDNREKIRRIAAEIEQLSAREAELDGRIARVEQALSAHRERQGAVEHIAAFVSFAAIDPAPHEREIAELQRERQAIEERSTVIPVLRQRLEQTRAQEIALQSARDEAVAEERELQTHIEGAERLLANATADLYRREADGSLAMHRESFAELEATCAEQPLDEERLFEEKDRFRSRQETRLRQLHATIEPLRTDLLNAMVRFARTFPQEHDLDAQVAYLDSFLGLRQRILEEDLPRHERRFKERLNEKVIQEIGLFRGELERERRAIQDRIETLNVSLRRLEYRPGTHIQLEPRPVRDTEITEFQGRLRECIEGSFDDTAEGNEARFVRIQELLHRLQDESNRRWRDKVTDVRRWFDFVAAVIDRETLKTVSSYEDSSGQSGGEKAKLAFTILVAAIAYQYDLNPEQPARDRFHFVVVDEMFSKVDDQHAEYALELFRHFGLQVLIVAPLDAKARVTQPYVGCYLHVHKRENRSEIFEMTAEEFDRGPDRDQVWNPQFFHAVAPVPEHE